MRGTGANESRRFSSAGRRRAEETKLNRDAELGWPGEFLSLTRLHVCRVGKRLHLCWRFLALGNEHLEQVRIERGQLVSYRLDLGGVVLVLKQ